MDEPLSLSPLLSLSLLSSRDTEDGGRSRLERTRGEEVKGGGNGETDVETEAGDGGSVCEK